MKGVYLPLEILGRNIFARGGGYLEVKHSRLSDKNELLDEPLNFNWGNIAMPPPAPVGFVPVRLGDEIFFIRTTLIRYWDSILLSGGDEEGENMRPPLELGPLMADPIVEWELSGKTLISFSDKGALSRFEFE